MSLVSHWFLSSSVRVSPVVVDVVIDVAASVAFRYAAVVSVFTFDHAVELPSVLPLHALNLFDRSHSPC